MEKNVPINKGNYSLDTEARGERFEKHRGFDWEAEYQKYRSDWSELPQKQIVRDYPLLVDLELASICNLKCPMCYTLSDEFKKAVNTTKMTWELYKKVIDEIAGKVPAIRLSLRGEATLNKNFIDCIKYAKENGIKEVSTLTHGFKLNQDFVEKIIDAGIDWITVSIDGTDETYNSIRKPLKFDDLYQKIKGLAEYKKLKGLKKPVIKIQSIWPAIEGKTDDFYERFKDISDLVAFNPLIDYLWNDSEIQYVENFTCPQQYQRLVVGADGLVMKCSNDEENKEVIGDVNTDSVHSIWHGEKMSKIRALHLTGTGFLKNDVCRRCYLPRETKKEIHHVGDREIIVQNYTKRTQIIGK
jgi:radical SAM protein with 4Fe4S-binding SPASM domain